MVQPSQEGQRDLEQRMTGYLLQRMNRAAYEEKLISEEVYQKIDASIRLQGAA